MLNILDVQSLYQDVSQCWPSFLTLFLEYVGLCQSINSSQLISRMFSLIISLHIFVSFVWLFSLGITFALILNLFCTSHIDLIFFLALKVFAYSINFFCFSLFCSSCLTIYLAVPILFCAASNVCFIFLIFLSFVACLMSTYTLLLYVVSYTMSFRGNMFCFNVFSAWGQHFSSECLSSIFFPI